MTLLVGKIAQRLVQRAIDTFGGLDILVQQRRDPARPDARHMDEAEWDAVVAVHLKGHFAPTRHAAAYWA